MPRPQPYNAHHVEPQVTFRAGCIAFGEDVRRAHDAALLRRRDGLKGGAMVAPRLDFDESYGAAALCDDVDLAKSRAGFGFQAPRQDAPPREPQPRDAQRFGEAPAPFGVFTDLRHLSLASSSARL